MEERRRVSKNEPELWYKLSLGSLRSWVEGEVTCEPVSLRNSMRRADEGHMDGRPSSSSKPQRVCMWAALCRRSGSGQVEDLGDQYLVTR